MAALAELAKMSLRSMQATGSDSALVLAAAGTLVVVVVVDPFFGVPPPLQAAKTTGSAIQAATRRA